MYKTCLQSEIWYYKKYTCQFFAVNSIRTKYGHSVWTPIRGSNRGDQFDTLLLEPGELIRAVYVSTTTYQTRSYIATTLCKINFLTNSKTFGPFGSCTYYTEKSFLFPNGLYYLSGSSATYLNQINFNSLCSNAKLVVPTRGIDY